MELSEQINLHEYLFLAHIGEPSENVLRLVVEEGVAGGEPEDLKIGDETLLSGVRPVAPDESCYEYEIVFGSYVAYSVRNESFTAHDPAEELTGRRFCVYTKSHFLDYVRAATFASDEHPGKLRHYGVNCEWHIIDVVTASEPALSVLRIGRPDGSRPRKWLS